MKTLAAALLISALGGCAVQRAQVSSEARQALIGLSKEDVLGCMGPPSNKMNEGSTEVWSYNSGDGRTTTIADANASTTMRATRFGNTVTGNATTYGFGSATTRSRYCVVNVVMTDARVSRVNYLGPTGGLLTGGEQCAYAVQACVSK